MYRIDTFFKSRFLKPIDSGITIPDAPVVASEVVLSHARLLHVPILRRDRQGVIPSARRFGGQPSEFVIVEGIKLDFVEGFGLGGRLVQGERRRRERVRGGAFPLCRSIGTRIGWAFAAT